MMHPVPLWDERQAAEALSLSVPCLRAWRAKCTGLPYVKLGRAVRYRPQDVERFIEAQLVRHSQ
jgi:predicted DNA-binding transcriptional regulator AlpA